MALLVNHSRPRFIFANAAKLGDLESIRTSAGIEKIICPGGDLTLPDLMAAETGSFRAVERAFGHRGHPVHRGNHGPSQGGRIKP